MTKYPIEHTLDTTVSHDLLSIPGPILIDENFKNLLQTQMSQYLNILKKLELDSFSQKPPEEITYQDMIFSDDSKYLEIKNKFELNKNKYDNDFAEIIQQKFNDKIPLLYVMQKMSIDTFNNVYLESHEKQLFFDGKNAEHWYLLPREFEERFKKNIPDIFKLNRYLGLSPFHDLQFRKNEENGIMYENTIGIHYCYIFLSYLSSPKKELIPINNEILEIVAKWEWNTNKFHNFLQEKYENKKFKCFCNFLEKKLIFNRNIDNLFKDYFTKKDKNNNNNDLLTNEFINDLNNLIKYYGEWDLVVWSIPWSGEGRTLDYSVNKINNKPILNGASEFYIPTGGLLLQNHTPIFTVSFDNNFLNLL